MKNINIGQKEIIHFMKVYILMQKVEKTIEMQTMTLQSYIELSMDM